MYSYLLWETCFCRLLKSEIVCFFVNMDSLNLILSTLWSFLAFEISVENSILSVLSVKLNASSQMLMKKW